MHLPAARMPKVELNSANTHRRCRVQHDEAMWEGGFGASLCLENHASGASLESEVGVIHSEQKRLREVVHAGGETNVDSRRSPELIKDALQRLRCVQIRWTDVHRATASQFLTSQANEIVKRIAAIGNHLPASARQPGNHGERANPLARSVRRLRRREIAFWIHLLRRAGTHGKHPVVAEMERNTIRSLQRNLDAGIPERNRRAGGEREFLLPHAQVYATRMWIFRITVPISRGQGGL